MSFTSNTINLEKLVVNDGELGEDALEMIAGVWSCGSFFAALSSSVTFTGTAGVRISSTIPVVGTAVGAVIDCGAVLSLA